MRSAKTKITLSDRRYSSTSAGSSAYEISTSAALSGGAKTTGSAGGSGSTTHSNGWDSTASDMKRLHKAEPAASESSPWEELASSTEQRSPSSLGSSLATGESRPLLSRKIEEKRLAQKKKLGMLFGVTMPCILSIFSVILFLRLGYVLGQAGFLLTLVMLTLGYGVVVVTVLSISAIATNGNVEGGGVYFMISRALGPEFGGSVGLIFFVANLFASATYVIGFVEAFDSSFGNQSGTYVQAIPDSYGFKFLYGSCILLFCLIVCLVGAGLFAKTTFIIFIIVMTSISSSMFSYGYVGRIEKIPLLADSNVTFVNESSYTSWSWETFHGNLYNDFTGDYSTDFKKTTFQIVFAVLFNGCTGIMAGANISGDLKSPSVSIPQGTLLACAVTYCIYVIVFTFSAFTCPRPLLLYNYNYLQKINVWGPLITVGVFAATLSAALSTLIGASRVLQALAKDRLFSGLLHPFTWTVGKSKEPVAAVLFSWLVVQVTILLGNLNTIAPIVTMFFLVSYGVVNLACFALKVASAPNFRPTFQVYARVTSAVGLLGIIALMFFIDPLYAAITIAVLVLLFVYLLIRAPATPWGDVSQALIYHQVRKYLLRLDVRKSHVKFWRPEVLLLVANPRSAYHLIDFTNDLKKGGLFVLGNIITKPFNKEVVRYHSKQVSLWMDFVEISKAKAFVELMVAPTIRAGAQSLLVSAGLGGMKPNTLALSYYSKDLPVSSMEDLGQKVMRTPRFFRRLIQDQSEEKFKRVESELPPLRLSPDDQQLSQEEYLGIIKDAADLGKNVCIMRHFEYFEKSSLKQRPYIDVWPLRIRYNEEFDNTFMFLLQLACVLHMKQEWKGHTKIRIFVIIENDMGVEREILYNLLQESRVEASVEMITPPISNQFCTFNESFAVGASQTSLSSLQYHRDINSLMREYSSESSIVFTSLPAIPEQLSSPIASSFIKEMDCLTLNIPPVVMVFGNMKVMNI